MAESAHCITFSKKAKEQKAYVAFPFTTFASHFYSFSLCVIAFFPAKTTFGGAGSVAPFLLRLVSCFCLAAILGYFCIHISWPFIYLIYVTRCLCVPFFNVV